MCQYLYIVLTTEQISSRVLSLRASAVEVIRSINHNLLLTRIFKVLWVDVNARYISWDVLAISNRFLDFSVFGLLSNYAIFSCRQMLSPWGTQNWFSCCYLLVSLKIVEVYWERVRPFKQRFSVLPVSLLVGGKPSWNAMEWGLLSKR